MGRIQEIVRSNGSILNTVVIPREIMLGTQWKKGDVLDFISLGEGIIQIIKEK